MVGVSVAMFGASERNGEHRDPFLQGEEDGGLVWGGSGVSVRPFLPSLHLDWSKAATGGCSHLHLYDGG